MHSNHQADVMKAVWDWRAGDRVNETSRLPAPRFVFLESSVAAGAGLLFMFGLGRPSVAVFAFCMAGFVLLSGLFAPRVHAGLKALLRKIAKGIGAGLTFLLLVPFFYIFFTLGRCSQRLRRKDPMSRTFPTQRETYWISCQPMKTADSYRRQY